MMDEEAIRTIIRQEIAAALRDLGKNAKDADGYETGQLESAGLQAVYAAAEQTSRELAVRAGTACPECGGVQPEHWWRCSRG